MIYLDNNASTTPDPAVIDAVTTAMGRLIANPSSAHHELGRRAQVAIEYARDAVASLLGTKAPQVVFTSGATEANNLALVGLWNGQRLDELARYKVLVGVTEHPSVIDAAMGLRSLGARVQEIPVDQYGVTDLGALEEMLDETVLLVSVMAANSETGTLQPLEAIARLAHARDALFHTDATQLVGRLPLDLDATGIDLASLSGHKFHGPKGTGALVVRRDLRIEPQLRGGGQERGRRSGTHNTPGIVGLGVACRLAKERLSEASDIAMNRNTLHRLLVDAGLPVQLNGHPTLRLPNTLNVRFEGADAEAVIAGMPSVACSVGSACHSGAIAPSHVLLAMGRTATHAQESLRFSLSRLTTGAEVSSAAKAIAESVANVREMLAEARLDADNR
jgi:cysteine desulfurase